MNLMKGGSLRATGRKVLGHATSYDTGNEKRERQYNDTGHQTNHDTGNEKPEYGYRMT